jgi:hypothetical protein
MIIESRHQWIVVAAIATLLAVVGSASAADVAAPASAKVATNASALAPIVNRDGPVTVTVTPRGLAAGTATWDFAVVLDTHSQSLSEDLAQAAALVDAQGVKHGPLAWEGAGPGGHHRQGVLKFEPLPPGADAVKLEISGVGGIPVRTFEWRLN